MRSARHRKLPLSIIVESPSQEADAKFHSPRRKVVLRREFLLLVGVVFIFGTNVLLHKNVWWYWRNRYLYVGCPEYSLWLRPHRQPSRVVHVTAKFGPDDDQYKQQVDNHVKKVVRSGVFSQEEIVKYTTMPYFITEDGTWEEHLRFMEDRDHESRLGAGFWFWKPVIIAHQLQMLEEGDFLIYSDVDREDFVSWTALLLETMVERDADLALEQMAWLENQWTKGDIYEKMCPELLPYYDPNTQYSANFVAIRKNPETTAFVSDWIEAAKNYHLISDEKSTTLKYKEFRANRHDQSLLSMLIRCSYDERGKQVFPFTCLGDWTAYTFRLYAESFHASRHR